MQSVRRSLARAAVAAAAVLVLAASGGCSAPVRAVREDPDDVYRTVHANVLFGGEPSVESRLVLERAELYETWTEDPAAALVRLHEIAGEGDTRERLYALAELSLHLGRKTGEPRWYLGSAVYSTLYLFGRADVPPPDAFDPQFRRACDFYERGLAGAFLDQESGEFRPKAGRMPLPVGELDVALPDDCLRMGEARFDQFLPSGEFEVEGLRSRVRTEGMGVPLIAARRDAPPAAKIPGVAGRMPPRLRIPGTAILDVEGELADLSANRGRATLRLIQPGETRKAAIRGHTVPLAVDTTAPIAYGLTESALWKFEFGGFLSADESGVENGVLLMTPYRKGKIPLVLVHGTASSPARWAELVNELSADPVLLSSYQVWLFIYNTGAPILVSAASLRSSLAATLEFCDPKGEDPALRRMVVMGHSQGGLLTRLQITTSGERFWRNISDQPFESMDFTEEERETFRSAVFFEPNPAIERVIFLATPHRGSFVAGGFFGKLGASLITLPKKMIGTVSDAVTRNVARIRGDAVGALPTAVDNMAPGSTFLAALDGCPLDPRVKVHSIVAVDGDGPPEEGDDGVVAYESAHLLSPTSEILVRSPHSCQGHPKTILEVRRILREHLQKPVATK